MITAEIMNWTGHLIAASRSDLDILLKRSEMSRTGIYILLGENPNNPLEPMAYIGEADQVKKRLYAHAKPADQNGKDFWNRVLVLTSKDANLTKAHARYLESRFISLAGHAKRAKLDNGTAPEAISLPEADVSDMEDFISQAQIVLPLLGVNLLRSSNPVPSPNLPANSNPTSAAPSPIFIMHLKKLQITARAREIDGEFVVLANSQARSGWTGVSHGYSQLKKDLEERSVIAKSADGTASLFVTDQVFASPSSAAAIIAGRSANGRKAWTVEGSQTTYGEWQNTKLEMSAASLGLRNELGLEE